jgi:CheY-like chemotaxis protein
MPLIYLVEDDYLQADSIITELTGGIPNLEIRRITTEAEFRERFSEIEHDLPVAVIMDVMLPWTEPSPEPPAVPLEVQENGFYRAGVRCAKLLLDSQTTKIPIILYTVLEHEDLHHELELQHPRLTHVRKESDSTKLLSKLRQLIRS